MWMERISAHGGTEEKSNPEGPLEADLAYF